LKVTKGHNSISSWCRATKPGVSRPHMQVHIPLKWQYNLKIHYQDMHLERKAWRTDEKRSDNTKTISPPLTPIFRRRLIN